MCFENNLLDRRSHCNTGVMNAPLTVVSPKMILALRKSARQKLKFALLALVSKNILCHRVEVLIKSSNTWINVLTWKSPIVCDVC